MERDRSLSAKRYPHRSTLGKDSCITDPALAVGDEDFRHKSLERMLQLIEKGSLVVLVTHGMDTIKELCSRAIWMEYGRLVADGKPSQVIESYRRCS
jgi:ABC-type polysaccharide/polyol phosphate transport system ATPase subunit